MKAGWKTVKLGEIAEIYNGNTVSDEDKKRLIAFPNAGLAFIATKDVGFDGVINYDNGINIPGDEAGDFKVARKNAVLVCAEGGSAGRKIGHIDRDVHFGNKLFALNASSAVLPRYLYHYCLSEDFRKKFKGLMAGLIGGVSVAKFKQIEIPLPPLAEQKRIVALLDEAFAGIDAAKAKAEACLTDAEESFNSLIDSKISCASVGAPCAALVELCDKNRVITYGVIKLGEPTRDGVYCLRCGNLKRLTIDLEGIRKIPDSLSKEYSRTVLKGGELLVNVRGTLGGVCVAPSSMSGWNVAREIAVVPLQPGAISAEYLSYHVASTTSQAWLMGKRKGAAYVGINIEDIRRLPIYLPSRKEQERIAGVLSEAQRHALDLQNIYEKKANKLLDLKSSLLTQAFAGELTA